MRCVHEAQMHEENAFLTLTYNNENLPEDKSVSKKVVSNFIKDLRHSLEDSDGKTIKPIRFFACGEYGDQLGRPHYHLCLFGHQFPDLELRARDKLGGHNHVYTSQSLENLWGKGFCTIGNLTFESAAYVARYVTKKITGQKAENHYQGKTPEFAVMSRMPGIGRPWIEKYLGDVYPKDFVHVNGIRMRPCRYYDSVMARHDVNEWLKIKEKRINSSIPDNDTPTRDMYSQLKYKEQQFKLLHRSLENGKT